MSDAGLTARLNGIAAEIAAGRLVPFFGPGLLAVEGAPVASDPKTLADDFHRQSPVPSRVRGNLWSTAQSIESRKHRQTVERMMTAAFQNVPPVSPLKAWIASLTSLPLVVDSWYDGELVAAFQASGRKDWGLVRGRSRNYKTGDRWFSFHDADGNDVDAATAAGWKTMLYKPHGGCWPAPDFLVSDADYVEVLTEIDIQSPIPELVRERRAQVGFVFVGCRFDDQMLRTYARQIIKRSTGPYFAIISGETTRMEDGFFEQEGITPLRLDLDEAVGILLAGGANGPGDQGAAA